MRYSTQLWALLDLLVGRVDVVPADRATLRTTFPNTEYGADFELVGPPVEAPRWLGYGHAVAVGKENEGLRRLFDRAVADIRVDGVLERIRRKWLAASISSIHLSRRVFSRWMSRRSGISNSAAAAAANSSVVANKAQRRRRRLRLEDCAEAEGMRAPAEQCNRRIDLNCNETLGEQGPSV